MTGETNPFQASPITARGLSYRTPGGQVLLEDVSFDLAQGAILAIAGPNGAGKTTLLNLLTGLLPITIGSVSIAGHDLAQMDAASRARMMAVVSQQSVPDARLSMRDYVALGQLPLLHRKSAKQHQAALETVLETMGLTALAHKTIGHLSGGERQRAHIARALAQEPHILFLDEPTNHLDPDAKGRVLSLVTAQNITVVMVIHDLVMIPEFASHVALVKGGRLSAFGPVAQVQTTQSIHDTFGVDYRVFHHGERAIPALDIRKTHPIKEGAF
ncbi:MAG: ABC transporter ATP-binding protein [Pseudomonadota bacterium]